MKELGYAKGYRYAHDEEDKVSDMDCLPDSLRAAATTTPRKRGAKSSCRAVGRDSQDQNA